MDPDDFGDGVDDYVPRFLRDDRPTTLAAYLEDEWKPGDALTLRAGMRVMSVGAPRTRMQYAPQLPVFPTFGLEWRF